MDISLQPFRGAQDYEVDRVELEARFQLERSPDLLDVLQRVPEPKYTYQIDFLTDRDGRRRKSVYFGQDGQQSHREDIVKTQLRKPIFWNSGFGGIKLALHSENPIDALTLNNTVIKVVRMKMRASIDYGEWRLDITMIKQLDNWTPDLLRGVRQSIMMPVSHIEDFADRAKHWDHVEYEVEWTGDSIPIQFDAMRWYRVLYPKVDMDYHVLIAEVAERIGNPHSNQYKRYDRKFDFNGLLPKAREVTLDTWKSRYWKDLPHMIVRDKIDGERRLLHIQNGRATGVANGKRLDLGSCQGDYLFDCEYHSGTWYVLHPLVFDGRVLVNMKDSERMELLTLPDVPGVQLALCRWRLVQGDRLQKFYNKRVQYPTDGYLLMDNLPYWQQRVVKWKATSTLDFLVHRCPPELIGKQPYVRENDGDTLWILMHGISRAQFDEYNKRLIPGWGKMFHNRDTYFPIQFSPHDNEHAHIWSFNARDHGLHDDDLHGAIVEFSRDTRAGRWKMVRIRKDRTSILQGGSYMGNSFHVVSEIWQKMHQPFPLEYIENPPDEPGTDLGHLLENWITGEGTLTAYNCTVRWDDNSLLQVVEPQYRWLAKNEKVHVAQWDEQAPREFIGGTDMIAVVGDVKQTRWNKWLKHGGTAFLLRMGDEPPCEDAQQIAHLKDGHRVWSWHKAIGGAIGMTKEQIKEENPHLRACSNAEFRFKFSRSKNREITAADKIAAADTSSMRIDPAWGIRLCLVECLSAMPQGSHIWYNGNLQLSKLFPQLHFIDRGGATRQNVHCYLDTQLDDWEAIAERIQLYKPDLFGYLARWDRLPKYMHEHKLVFIPYANPAERLVWITGDAKRQQQQYNNADVLRREMDYFHGVYRPSCYKHTCMIPGLDNCWDCRSEAYILQRYARSPHATKREKGVRLRDHMEVLRTRLQTI